LPGNRGSLIYGSGLLLALILLAKNIKPKLCLVCLSSLSLANKKVVDADLSLFRSLVGLWTAAQIGI
jgi:hypothetical protein